MEERKRIFYLCDGEVPQCKKRTCYKHSHTAKPCKHTTDIEHAINFRKPRTKQGSYFEKEKAAQENLCAAGHDYLN